MTALDDPVTITVEGSARIVRGVLIPYNRPTIVGDRLSDGSTMFYEERFDQASCIMPTTAIPLLQSHDESRPVGKVKRMWHDDSGLQIEAELVGSSNEIDGLRERIGHNLLTGLSVGFICDPKSDDWRQATTPGKLPRVTRRGARIREASLVLWPAYSDARVTAIRNRTEMQRQSDQLIAEYHARKQARQAELMEYVNEVRAQNNIRRAEQHARSERVKAEIAQLRKECDLHDQARNHR